MITGGSLNMKPLCICNKAKGPISIGADISCLNITFLTVYYSENLIKKLGKLSKCENTVAAIWILVISIFWRATALNPRLLYACSLACFYLLPYSNYMSRIDFCSSANVSLHYTVRVTVVVESNMGTI